MRNMAHWWEVVEIECREMVWIRKREKWPLAIVATVKEGGWRFDENERVSKWVKEPR